MATRKNTAPVSDQQKTLEAARDTFEALLHSAESAESKLVILELARRGGGETNLSVLASGLKLSVGQLDRGCHGLERRGLIRRPKSDVIALTEANMDLVDMLGPLADPEDETLE